MQVTNVLVVLNSSTYYGEDLREIDILEQAVRKAILPIKKATVVFMITSDVEIDRLVGGTDYIAFCHYSAKAMYEAFKKGMKVLDYNEAEVSFEEVRVEKRGDRYVVIHENS